MKHTFNKRRMCPYHADCHFTITKGHNSKTIKGKLAVKNCQFLVIIILDNYSLNSKWHRQYIQLVHKKGSNTNIITWIWFNGKISITASCILLICLHIVLKHEEGIGALTSHWKRQKEKTNYWFDNNITETSCGSPRYWNKI